MEGRMEKEVREMEGVGKGGQGDGRVEKEVERWKGVEKGGMQDEEKGVYKERKETGRSLSLFKF